MKAPVRWPLHSSPVEGEALSSWLRRIADSYHLGVTELLEHDLGPGSPSLQELDLNPPSPVLELLARRTGVEPARLARMSLNGWTPWLLDMLEPDTAAFETYVRQLSVLLPPGKRPQRTVPDWRAWIPQYPLQRACPQCLSDPGRQGLLLMWQLPLLLSCPEHGCLLETCIGFPSVYLEWTGESADPRPADEQIRATDRLTWQALTTGKVQLPRRSVHAGIWFRLLRTLIDELSTPVTYWGKHSPNLREIWQSCGLPVRAGQSIWRPFEYCPWPVQAQLLKAVAAAIDLLETGSITGRGAYAGLFRPEPHKDVGSDEPPVKHWRGKGLHLKSLGQAMEEAVQAARDDPAEAQALYKLVLYGCRTQESVARLRADFVDMGIPLQRLSHIKN